MGRVTGECREWVWSVELYIGLMVNFPGGWRMSGWLQSVELNIEVNG